MNGRNNSNDSYDKDDSMTALDLKPLTRAVSKEEVAAFRRGGRSTASVAARIVVALVVAAVFGMAAMVFVTSNTMLSDPADNSSASPFGGLLSILPIALIAGVVFLFVRLIGRHSARRRLRLHEFAEANGLVFNGDGGRPSYPGAIFGIGNGRRIGEHLYRKAPRYLDFGTYRYTTGSGKNRTTHTWGYVAIKLERMLPHLVLDAKSNNFLGSNLPVSFRRSQTLSLEGDFDRYFRLYCPSGYERDALYVFTPDLMALLIDESDQFDVEIVDDWLFVYSATGFDLADPGLVTRLFRIVDTVGAKTLDQTHRYADDRAAETVGHVQAVAPHGEPTTHHDPLTARLASNTVARQGRRLRAGVPILAIAVMAIVVAIWLFNFAPMVLGFLSPDGGELGTIPGF